MPPSKASICNMALSHLGVSDAVTDVDTESSKEAQACRLFYEACRDDVLRAFAWPFAVIIEDLTIVEEDPNDEWAFSYRYPSGCLAARRLLSGTRTDSQNTVVPYRVARDASGRVIFTDLEDAQIEYTSLVDAEEEWDSIFVSALTYLLAFKIAPRLAGGDESKLGDRAFKLYLYELSRAQAAAANEERPDLPPDAELITART